MKVFVLYTGYENDVELFETVEGAMTHGKRSIDKWTYVQSEKRYVYDEAEDTGDHDEGGWKATIEEKRVRIA